MIQGSNHVDCCNFQQWTMLMATMNFSIPDDVKAKFNTAFDTLHRAVALEDGATLVTSDEAYFRKAKGLGGVQLLSDFAI